MTSANAVSGGVGIFLPTARRGGVQRRFPVRGETGPTRVVPCRATLSLPSILYVYQHTAVGETHAPGPHSTPRRRCMSRCLHADSGCCSYAMVWYAAAESFEGDRHMQNLPAVSAVMVPQENRLLKMMTDVVKPALDGSAWCGSICITPMAPVVYHSSYVYIECHL